MRYRTTLASFDKTRCDNRGSWYNLSGRSNEALTMNRTYTFRSNRFEYHYFVFRPKRKKEGHTWGRCQDRPRPLDMARRLASLPIMKAQAHHTYLKRYRATLTINKVNSKPKPTTRPNHTRSRSTNQRVRSIESCRECVRVSRHPAHPHPLLTWSR
jgi:hypothetical protein